MPPEPKGDSDWASWGPAPTPREYFERLIAHEAGLRKSDWNAHQAKHIQSDHEQEGIDERLNDVRLRFIGKAEFQAELRNMETRMEALARLVWGLLLISLVALAGVVATLATR